MHGPPQLGPDTGELSSNGYQALEWMPYAYIEHLNNKYIHVESMCSVDISHYRLHYSIEL